MDENGSPPWTRRGRQQPAAAAGVVRKPVEFRIEALGLKSATTLLALGPAFLSSVEEGGYFQESIAVCRVLSNSRKTGWLHHLGYLNPHQFQASQQPIADNFRECQEESLTLRIGFNHDAMPVVEIVERLR
jgi:hypothetical protein